MRARLSTFVLAAMLAAPHELRSQATARDSVAAVASAFFRAMADARWRDAASYLDLAPFEAYRAQLVTAMRARRTAPPPTIEQVMAGDPDMPLAVAEYQLERMQRMAAQQEDFRLREFAEVPNVDSLAALSSEEAVARWLRAKDLRWMVRRAWMEARDRGCPPDRAPPADAPRPPDQIIAIAVADSTAYVVHEPGRTFEQREAANAMRGSRDAISDFYGISTPVLELARRGGRWVIPARWNMFSPLGVPFVASCDTRTEGPVISRDSSGGVVRTRVLRSAPLPTSDSLLSPVEAAAWARADSAALRTDSIAVASARIELHIGDTLSFHALGLRALDRSGAVVPGFVPFYDLVPADPQPVALRRASILAIAPGTATLLVHSYRRHASPGGRIPDRPMTRIEIVVKPR